MREGIKGLEVFFTLLEVTRAVDDRLGCGLGLDRESLALHEFYLIVSTEIRAAVSKRAHSQATGV
jgi:hypothetical protein